jgi:hypothetical protein
MGPDYGPSIWCSTFKVRIRLSWSISRCVEFVLKSSLVIGYVKAERETDISEFLVSILTCLTGREDFSRFMSRDNTVGIATGYGMEDRGVGVRVTVGSRIFSSRRRPDRIWGLASLLSNGYWEFLPRGNVAGAWSWPFTSNYCHVQENVDLYIHAPIRLHSTVLN